MKWNLILAVAVAFTAAGILIAEDKGDKKVPAVLNFTMKGIDGKPVELSKYQGKVVLLVNVASQCGYTKQYTGLEVLHEKYGKDGLVVLGVPANDFGAQEPGSDEEIKKFCTAKFNVGFDMLSKVSVKGDNITPLYKYLTSKETNPKYAGDISWNFEKFLIGKNGEVVGRYKSRVAPEDKELVTAIEAELKK